MRPTQDFQVVVLQSPFFMVDHPMVRELFGKALALKRIGYGDRYPEGVIPVDTTDFVGTHVLLCRRTGDRYEPVMGFRSITNAQCKRHFLKFPLLAIAENSNAMLQAGEVKRIIDECIEKECCLHYNGGWTIHPEIRKDPTIASELKNIMMALDFLYHDGVSKPYEVLGAGVVRMKTDVYFQSYGYDWMKDRNGELLPLVNSHYLAGEPVRFIHVKAYRENAMALADRYRDLWEQRVVFKPEKSTSSERGSQKKVA